MTALSICRHQAPFQPSVLQARGLQIVWVGAWGLSPQKGALQPLTYFW